MYYDRWGNLVVMQERGGSVAVASALAIAYTDVPPQGFVAPQPYVVVPASQTASNTAPVMVTNASVAPQPPSE
jgi:hypothetical protein